MSEAKVALGSELFGDSRLSVTGAYSCASCHRPELAFTDGLPNAVGATGERHARNTPGLFNVAYNASFGWADPNTRTLEAQHLIPMYNTEPVELGLNEEQVARLLDQLLSDQRTYRQLRRAFPELDRQSLQLQHVVQALASYVRSLVVADSASTSTSSLTRTRSLRPRRGACSCFSRNDWVAAYVTPASICPGRFARR